MQGLPAWFCYSVRGDTTCAANQRIRSLNLDFEDEVTKATVIAWIFTAHSPR